MNVIGGFVFVGLDVVARVQSSSSSFLLSVASWVDDLGIDHALFRSSPAPLPDFNVLSPLTEAHGSGNCTSLADQVTLQSEWRHPDGASGLCCTVAGSRLARWMGVAGPIQVNSQHHQGIAVPGDRVCVVARAPDQLIEAVELRGEPVVGVQWHPEVLWHTCAHAMDLMRGFAAECARIREVRSDRAVHCAERRS